MSDSAKPKTPTGSVHGIYQSHLVPLIFDPYAEDMVNRLRILAPARILEVAAGTGAVTRRMAEGLPGSSSIVATDINPAMLEQASAAGTSRPVEWRQADALNLPFEDGSFDAVIAQFGAMFYPDRPKAYSEARRVLKPGGVFIFNVWDRIGTNDFADIVARTVADLFPGDPPGFLSRTPYGHFDVARLGMDLAEGGFAKSMRFETVTARSRAATSMLPAIARRFGSGPVDGGIQAIVTTATA